MHQSSCDVRPSRDLSRKSGGQQKGVGVEGARGARGRLGRQEACPEARPEACRKAVLQKIRPLDVLAARRPIQRSNLGARKPVRRPTIRANTLVLPSKTDHVHDSSNEHTGFAVKTDSLHDSSNDNVGFAVQAVSLHDSSSENEGFAVQD